jgi:RNA polymerase sigma-70 factor (ECF subfamily)
MTDYSEKNHDLDRKEDRFFRLFSVNQSEIFSYIISLVPHSVDAEDIFQETCSVMWRKFDAFQIGTHFVGWACKIAYYIILEHRRKAARTPLRYSSETLKLLSDSYAESQKDNKQRIELLNACLRNLSDKERFLIQQRYNQSLSVNAIAEQLSVSANMIYKSLAKIHYFLLECIQRSLVSGERK